MKHCRAAARPPALASSALVALVVLGTAACGSTTGRVESAIEDELHEIVGPADEYDVEIEGLRLGDGEADRVIAVGHGLHRLDAPRVQRIDLEMSGVRYDRDAGRLQRLDSARATATVTPSDLAAYLERQQGVSDADVRLEAPDRAVLTLRPDLGGFPLPPGAAAEVGGRIVGEGSYLRFELGEVRAAGLGLGSGALETMTRLINPLLDLSDLPIAFDLHDVRVEDGLLRLQAVAGPTSLR